MSNSRFTLGVSLLLSGFYALSRATAGMMDPTNAPGPTMHTLDEIYQKVSWLSSSVVGLTTVTNPVTTFSAGIPKTGQTNLYLAGDDGTYQKGMVWPNPRFTVGNGLASNCVLDNLSGLMWLRNPIATARDWTNAVAYCNALDGAEGRGGHLDWRLPNKRELESLVEYRDSGPALPDTTGAGHWKEGDPFTGIQPSDSYWSSTAYAALDGAVWTLNLYDGSFGNVNISTQRYAWPVRDGQEAISYSRTNPATGGEANISNEDKGPIGSPSFAGQCNLTPVKPGSFHLFITAGADGQFTDDGSGLLNGSFDVGGGAMISAAGTINYDNGAYGISLGPAGSTVVGRSVTITYTVFTSP